MSYEEFQNDEVEQKKFGLLSVANYLSDYQIQNTHSLNIFYKKIRSVMDSISTSIWDTVHVQELPSRKKNELYRCLRVLWEASSELSTIEFFSSNEKVREIIYKKAPPLNCGDISRLDAKRFQYPDVKEMRQNNINRTLKRHPGLCERGYEDNRVTYKILPNGFAFVAAFEKLHNIT
jgi:hypothetical protein